MDPIQGLLASRKFVVVALAVVTLGAMVLTGKLPVNDFVSTLERLVTVLVAAFGVEGAAEKWNAPPPGTVNIQKSESKPEEPPHE